VVGAGPAGMRAALDLARCNHIVHLVEKEESPGGMLRHIHRLFPSMESASSVLSTMVGDLYSDQRVVVHAGCEVEHVGHKDDMYEIRLRSLSEEGDLSDSRNERLFVGAIILATGLEPIDPSIIPEFGYGRFAQVITSLELEHLLASGGLMDRVGEAPSITFIQCVGSRVRRRGVPYCSAVCCAGAIKNALLIKEALPQAEVHILYIDIRTHGKDWEEMYRSAREMGVQFIRGQPSLVVSGVEGVKVCGENTLLKELYEISSDLVVLQVGLRNPEPNRRLLRSMGVEMDPDGLPLMENMTGKGCRQPPGLFLAGALESPKDLKSCMEQASCSALRAHLYLENGRR
jgi:heterodisulfide reductase subunit A2